LKKTTLKELQQLLKRDENPPETFQPFQNIHNIASFKDAERIGIKALEEGKAGSILVAGGQGTRLGFKGPKGSFPVTPATNQTLFQYFTEKLKAASHRYKQPLKMAIMTSSENHEATTSYFSSHHFFGASPSQISFFKQGELPMLQEDGGEPLAMGSDGNGACPEAFFDSGIADTWIKEGIEYATFILVDNPLADPFDPALIGAHIQEGVEVSIKCIRRTNSEEKLGILVAEKKIPKVVEYSEVPKPDWELRDPSGNLVFGVANISLFCFSLPFLRRVSTETLPLHPALKKIGEVSVWKFEKFIFDILPFSRSTQALLYPREITFAPLKNSSGDHSLETAQRALSQKDRKILEAITGTSAPSSVLEIAPSFHYPDQSLLAKWKGKLIPPSSYVAS
jgi:UDP-N-acetylglucosamine/UDP-N-acetylgalactosamine diphosphorylase